MNTPKAVIPATVINQDRFVGTLVGESTSRMFRLAVAHETIREQDIIAVDVELRATNPVDPPQQMRLWAKVQQIERINPLFPNESAHELAETRTNPFDTVLSLSREMVTAVCQVLGSESLNGQSKGRLDNVRYPPKPATQAYKPDPADLSRIVVGELGQIESRSLNIATLSNDDKVDVKVDGDAIVNRHLAILAMTGAGKSVTARRIVAEIAKKDYPVVIFDPHGDYKNLGTFSELTHRVQRYYATFPIFEEDPDKVIQIVESLAGWKLADTHKAHFETFFYRALAFYQSELNESTQERSEWLSKYLNKPNIAKFGIKPDLYFFADYVEALSASGRADDQVALQEIDRLSGSDFSRIITKGVAKNIENLPHRLRKAAKVLRNMEDINKESAKGAIPLPMDRTELVKFGKVSIIALDGYTPDFQATIYSLIASEIFQARVRNQLKLPVLLVLEEAHNFVPSRANTTAEERSIAITKQIAQEGRKFGVGLVMISQRPSRLDETALAMCNSFIIMRMINPADQSFVRKVIESLGEGEANMLPDLSQGEAILSGQFVNFPILARIKPLESQDQLGNGQIQEDAFQALKKNQKQIQEEQNKQNGNSRRP